jgi:hypothetical protein
VTARLGRGRIVWSLDDTPITNEGLPRASNVRLLANAVGAPGARRILWDEHYHGERRSIWSYFARSPLRWAGAQLLLAALLALIAVTRRRGPIRTRAMTPRTSPLEFVETMASLYERAGAGPAAIEGARARLHRRLSAASGVSRRASEDAAAKAAARLGIGEGRVRDALQSAADLLRRGVPRSADTVAVVAELQTIAAAVDRARSGQGHHT